MSDQLEGRAVNMHQWALIIITIEKKNMYGIRVKLTGRPQKVNERTVYSSSKQQN